MAIDFDKIRQAAAVKDRTAQAAGLEAKTAYKPMVNGVALEQNHSGAASAPDFGERVSKTASGWAQRTAAAHAGTLEDLTAGLGKLGSVLQDKKEQRLAAQEREYLAKYEQELAEAMASGDAMAIKTAQTKVNQSKYRLKTMGDLGDYYDEVNREAVADIDAFGDRMSAGAEQDFTRAKEGAGAVGRVAVDAATLLADVGADAAANMVVPGLGTAARVSRMYGQGSERAEDKGFDLGTQALYGGVSAALGEATNRILNSNPILQKAGGKGFLDGKILQGMDATRLGRTVKSAGGEAVEETLENGLDWLAQTLIFGSAKADKPTLKDAGYDALLAALVGGTTGVISPNPSGNAPRRSAGEQIAQSEGSNAPVQEKGAEDVSGDIMTAEAQRLLGQNKTAPEVGAEQITTQENIARYRSDIDEVFSGKYPSGKVVQMGETPSILLKYGAQQRPVTITQNAAYKIAYPQGYMGGKHNLGMSALKQLPYQIADPVAILKSASQDNSLVIVTEWKDGNTDVIIPLHLNKHGALELENSVASAYGKGHIDSILGQNNENVLYTKDNEDIRQLLSKGVQFPQAMADDILAKNSMPQAGANVNVDPLLKMMMGGKRLDQSKASNEQFAALADRGDIGVDAAGKMFQIDPAQHIDQRTTESVGSRKVNAFQFDHPQLHTYFQQAAQALMADADISLQFGMQRNKERTMQGNRMRQQAQTSQHLRRAMDETGLSRSEIIDAAQRIVNDKGQENVKAAKQVEIILDDMLTHGWQPMMGDGVGPNQAYIDAKNEIAGSQPVTEDGHGLDGVGAARAGSLNSDYENLQAQSDSFHPEGAYAARPVDVPTQNFDGSNIPRGASNIMGGQALDEHDVRFLEQQIADGKLAFDTITDSDSVSRAQTTMAEKGFDGALEQYRQAVNSGVATKDNTTLGQQLLLSAMRDGNVRYTAELLSLYTRNSTNAAQALQAQSIFRKLSPEGQLVAVQKAVDALNEKYGTEVQIDEADVAEFLNAETEEARKEVEKRIVKKAAKAVPGTFKAKFDTIRYLAMLGNPRTHIRNILGNTLFQVPVAVKNRVGAVAEGIAYAASGGKTERTKSLFGVNPMGKLASEARADWVNVKDFLSQNSTYAEGKASLSAIEQEAHAFSDENLLGRGVNALADANSKLLEAEDMAAKRLIYTQSLAGYLKANGCKSIADADPALLNKARAYAADEALRNTFNDKNAVSSAASMLSLASQSKNPALRAGGYIVEGLVPFKKTPANILVRAAEYSPVGAALGTLDIIRGAKSGDTETVTRGLDRLSAGVTGTALMTLGALAAGNGWVRGREDEDEKQATFDELTGHQAYALELKDGTSITLDWLAPEAIPFFMGVELYNAALDGGLSLEDLGATLKNATAPMLELSMLQGLNDTFDNAAYAKYSGGSVMGSIITSALTNYVTQVVPTVGGQIERSTEDVRMTTYTDKNSQMSTDMQYTLGKVSQKLPFDFQQIPYIDAWGREEATGDPLVRAANNLFNPAYVSQVDVDRVEQELQRLKDVDKDNNVFPVRAEKSVSLGEGKEKHLSADEYVAYAKDLGQTSYKMVQAGLNTAAYRSMSDAQKVEYIEDLYSYARASATANAGGKAMEGWQLNARNAQRDLGVSTAEYIALYQKYGSSFLSGEAYEKTKQAVKGGLTVDEYVSLKTGANTNGKSGVNADEARAVLDNHPKRVDLWDIICTTNAKNPYA